MPCYKSRKGGKMRKTKKKSIRKDKRSKNYVKQLFYVIHRKDGQPFQRYSLDQFYNFHSVPFTTKEQASAHQRKIYTNGVSSIILTSDDIKRMRGQ